MDPDLVKEYLLTAFPNPQRKDCPDEDTLKALAERRLALSDPALVHVASCSPCFEEYLDYCQDWQERGGKSAEVLEPVPTRVPKPSPSLTRPVAATRSVVVPWTIAAALAVVIGGGLFVFKEHQTPASSLVASSSGRPLDASVDLFQAVTVRGGGDDAPAPLEEVSVPSSIVHLTVTLPRFSQSGAYEILVAKDRAGKDVVAQGLGNAVEADGKVGVVVTLDLRKTAPGMYFLATVRGSDSGTYYYPLRVR